MKNQKGLTKKQDERLNELLSSVYLTIAGRYSIAHLIKDYGAPIIIQEFATIEVLTGKATAPTIKIDRGVCFKLKFSADIEIFLDKKSDMLLFANSNIEKRRVRHPSYRSDKMPRATKKEKNLK